MAEHSPQILASKEKATTTTTLQQKYLAVERRVVDMIDAAILEMGLDV